MPLVSFFYRVAHKVKHSIEAFVGAGNWTRTSDLLITNQLLYQLSYASIVSGAGNGSRTRNLQLGRLTL
jgi:hypothetical protein